MIDVNIYTNDRYFQVKPKGLVITRRYEENEYAFVASDVKFDCFGVQDLNDSMFDDPRNRNLFEAKELYDAIFSGAEVFCVIIKNDAKIFYGIFQRDGTSFDPE
ncbi:MAG: hypothetical protein H3C35_08560, partial [Bacteroidetes bacterium]|nr:hypothetical protein [Bacteroidota bacterium]